MSMFLHRHVFAYKEENGMHSATESAHAPALILRPPPMGPQGRPHLEGFLRGTFGPGDPAAGSHRVEHLKAEGR